MKRQMTEIPVLKSLRASLKNSLCRVFAIGNIDVTCGTPPFLSQRELRRLRKEYQEWFLSEENELKVWIKEYISEITLFF